MDLADLCAEIEDLELVLLSPKLFIKKYFEDLINLLDIQTTKIDMQQNKRIKVSDGKSNKISASYVEELENWRQSIVKELEKVESDLLVKITPEFKIDTNLKAQAEDLIKIFKKQDGNEKKYNDLEPIINECSYRIKRHVMDNQCFLVLSQEMVKKIKDVEINSYDLWNKVMPIIHLTKVFIGRKGSQLYK